MRTARLVLTAVGLVWLAAEVRTPRPRTAAPNTVGTNYLPVRSGADRRSGSPVPAGRRLVAMSRSSTGVSAARLYGPIRQASAAANSGVVPGRRGQQCLN